MADAANTTMIKPKRRAGYEVGYGKPPADHRFRKGQSGNPRGRPRGHSAPLGRRDLLDALTQAAREPIAITKDGRTIRTTQIEALAQQLTRKALQGDMRAAKLLFDNIKALAPADEPDGMSFEERLLLLDEGPKDPPGITVRFVDAGDIREKPVGT
ncbi:DUF5681 domain-containing protein [Methylobacterium sp. E-045]|uniref:DUF5681 domain-containing protein n=1 Tax=Methylobacterium sp. E-045 TaxID=2836575 RepID=UPI001FBA9A9E|nr:DUF5681 domain-containing protein [Methylobacterium sp. E-045]MCJ2127277.1 DUF5681 domain-containing protein [Methylobacterium sp. E-045]